MDIGVWGPPFNPLRRVMTWMLRPAFREGVGVVTVKCGPVFLP